MIKSKFDSRQFENDENSSNALNSQTCKEFELSKNAKRSLGSIVIDEKRVRSIMKKTGSISSNRALKKEIIKITDATENTLDSFRVNLDFSPIMD